MCSLLYPLVWGGAGVIALVAGLTSDVETDTKGLGDAIAGFVIGALVLNVVWAGAVFAATKRFGRPIRSVCAALGAPAAIITGLLLELAVGMALAVGLPALACWWATEPEKSAHSRTARQPFRK